MPFFFVFLTFFIWSSVFSIGKTALGTAPPLFLTGARMVAGGIILLAFLFLFRRRDFKISKKHIFPLVLLSLFSVYLTNAFEFWGLQYLSAAKTCFIYSLSPFLAALFSYFQFKEKMTPKKWLGLLVGFIGFLPVLRYQSGAENLLGGLSFLSFAEIALILATITSVYGWVLLRKLGKEDGINPLMANGFSMVLGGIFALTHSFFAESGWSPLPITNYSLFLEGIVLMILISNIICYNLYGWLLKKFTATFLSFAGLMTPLFAAFFGWILLGETVPPSFFLSLGIIFVGLWLVYSEELRLGYLVKRESAPTLAKPQE